MQKYFGLTLINRCRRGIVHPSLWSQRVEKLKPCWSQFTWVVLFDGTFISLGEKQQVPLTQPAGLRSICPGTLLGIHDLKLSFSSEAQCKFNFLTFLLSLLDLRFWMTFWSIRDFWSQKSSSNSSVKPGKPLISTCIWWMYQSVNLLDTDSVLFQAWLANCSVSLPPIFVQNVKLWCQVQGNTGGPEAAIDSVGSENPCQRVLHFCHVSLHRRLWSLSQWLNGCQRCTSKKKMKRSCFQDGPQSTTTVKSLIYFAVFPLDTGYALIMGEINNFMHFCLIII